jgi:excinuclease ABC subunit C
VFAASAEFFASIPTAAGVYVMKDADGEVVYVGKAKNLRVRVKQYFRPGDDTRFFVAAGLLRRVLATVDTMVVDNEKEALLLENHLIKKHQPRFNVKLRDDKQYLVLRVDPAADFPRVEVVRNIKDDGARYFGPYHSATSCRETLRTVNRYFQLRTCTDHVLKTRRRVCLQYQIKRCPGPCVYDVDASAYGEQVEDVMMFLSGKRDAMVPRLRQRMDEASGREAFERAAQLRDTIAAVERTMARQNVVQDAFVDQDVFGLHRKADVVDVAVLFVRAGKLVGQRTFRQREQEFPDGEVLGNFVQQYYATGTFIPSEVVTAIDIDDTSMVGEWLSGRRGKKVRVISPKRGQRTKLIDLANKNAEAAAAANASKTRDTEEMLSKVQARLALKRLPRRIECYDIAHIQGAETVASMVVFMDGEPERSHYRKFKIRSVANDDFSAMYEVLGRRFKRAKGDGGDAWQWPDLLVVDGGKGQLGKALAALSDLGVPTVGENSFDVVALAKEREDGSGTLQPDRVFRANLKDPMRLRQNTNELYLLARIRDEAHRTANAFHRQRRGKATLRSALDDIAGVGPARRKRLLRHFGSVKGVRGASVDELAEVPGITEKLARAIRSALNSEGGSSQADGA